MSLNYNLDSVPLEVRTVIEISDSMDTKQGDRVISPITREIIFATMRVGINSITEDNYVEFWRRLRLYEAIAEERVISFRADDLDGKRITIQDIKDHIGLYTNATNYTETRWHKKLIEDFYITLDISYKRHAEEYPLWRRLKNWLQSKQPEVLQEFPKDEVRVNV